MPKQTFDPWPSQHCLSDASGLHLSKVFAQTLTDAAEEAPLQKFLAGHSNLLTCFLPPGREAWCWDRPRLGSEWIPDFLLSTRNSKGFEWVMVELESPAVRPLTQAGLPASKLNQALGQVRDWRSWIRTNIAYAYTELGFAGLTAESQAIIVIGRRNGLNPSHALKWRELSDNLTQVMTYDRLLETISRGRLIDGEGKNGE